MKKIIPFLFSFLLITTLFFGFMSFPVISAEADIGIEGFDTYAEGVQLGTNVWVSWIGERGITSTTKYKTVPMSLKVPMNSADASTTYINLTTNMSMSGFEFWFLTDVANDDCYTIIELYDETDTAFVKFRIYHQNTNDVDIYDYDTWHTFGVMGADNNWWCFGFQGNHSAENPDNYVYYYMKNVAGTIIYEVEKRWISLNEYNVEKELSKIKIISDDNDADVSNAYLDEFTVITGGEIGGEGGESEFPVSQWFKIGDASLGTYSSSLNYDNVFFEELYNVVLDTTIKAIDLYVPVAQYNTDSNPSHYKVYIGDNVPNTEFAPYYTAVAFIPFNGNYLIRWYLINHVVDSTVTSLSFRYDGKFVAWTSFSDADKDGNIEHLSHWNVPYGMNYQYDRPSEGNTKTRDLSYHMYIESFEISDAPENDYIDTNVNNIDVYSSINIVYGSKDLSVVNKLVINDGSNDVYNETINVFKSNYWYTPVTVSTHTASIYRSDMTQVSCSFSVNAIDESFYIYTVENPTVPNENFFVYFNYSGTVTGAILLKDSDENILETWLYETVPIQDSFRWSISTEGIYYFDLCYTVNTSFGYAYTTKIRHRHIVKDSHLNFIKCRHDIISWVDSIDGYNSNVITGEHNFLGSNVVITFNGGQDKYVGHMSVFIKLYQPTVSGGYNVSLILRLSDSIVVLAYTSFVVAERVAPSDFENIFNSVPLWIRGIMGAIITLLFVFMPFVMMQYLEKINFKVDVPPVAYAISGGIGVTLCTIIGLFGWEIMFFICVVAGMSVLISYLWQKRGE